MEEQTVLVTGAAGFIGSHVCEALMALGHRVVGVDNFDPFYARAIKEANVGSIAAAASGRRFELEELDVTDAPRFGQLVARLRPHAVLHRRAGGRAAVTGAPRRIRARERRRDDQRVGGGREDRRC
jgi:nucleoside-diphosphate-sugar epimerase